ncbi:unnamed protein product, partial [Ectocarpus sp. 12 AP-2014]
WRSTRPGFAAGGVADASRPRLSVPWQRIDSTTKLSPVVADRPPMTQLARTRSEQGASWPCSRCFVADCTHARPPAGKGWSAGSAVHSIAPIFEFSAPCIVIYPPNAP